MNTIKGVTTNAIEPGVADITLADETQQNEVFEAIAKAGYTVTGVEARHDSADAGKTFTFKTNINCNGCVAKVAPELNAAEGVCHWDVNVESKDKILSVHSDGIKAEEVIKAVEKAGFKIELINA